MTLGDIAAVTDGFEEDRVVMRYNGKHCAVVHVARTGSQHALKIAAAEEEGLAREQAHAEAIAQLG